MTWGRKQWAEICSIDFLLTSKSSFHRKKVNILSQGLVSLETHAVKRSYKPEEIWTKAFYCMFKILRMVRKFIIRIVWCGLASLILIFLSSSVYCLLTLQGNLGNKFSFLSSHLPSTITPQNQSSNYILFSVTYQIFYTNSANTCIATVA